MIIETPRLRLRAFRRDDIDPVVAGLNDWTIAQWLSRTPFPYAVSDAEAWLADAGKAHAGGRFAIADRGSDALIGAIGIEPDGADRELGYWLGIGHWGRGLERDRVEMNR